MATLSVQPAPYSAPSKSTSSIINNSLTTVTRTSFTDKLLVTITSSASSGKLSHWVHVPLSSASADPMNPSFSHLNTDPSTALLPRSDLTATTVLGGTKRDDEVLGQTLVTTLGTAILTKRPSEERMLVLGLGLPPAMENGKEWFEEVVGMCLEVL